MRPMQELAVAIDAMGSEPSLWHCYFNNFITHKLQLVGQGDIHQGDFAQKILHTFFKYLHDQKTCHKMVRLHCYVKIYHLNLAQITTILRPLSKVEKVSVIVCESDNNVCMFI